METLGDWTRESGFPTFTPLFEKPEEQGVLVPLYLTLLSKPSEDEARLTSQFIHHAVQYSPDVAAEVVALFADPNWRPQLVAAVAMILGTVTPETLRALWQAFDSGSWISPQLAVTAFYCDPDFESEARRRIEANCPIGQNRIGEMDWRERHSAAGPISFAVHSNKALASLVTLCRTLPNAASWLEPALADETIQKSLQGDTDGAESIVTDWRAAVKECFGAVEKH